jgi:hypothetical protein
MEQCAHDSYLEAIREQEGEGCHLWGALEVNKVGGLLGGAGRSCAGAARAMTALHGGARLRALNHG